MIGDDRRTEEVENPWEAAYLRFETPEEEINKFVRRLQKLGARDWPREARVVELFCGRGNGLHALDRLGFRRIEGADLSRRLVAVYQGAVQCYVCDCRSLPFPDQSRDILVVQGGLHHLLKLPEDLGKTLREARRVLVPGGRVVIIEPWLTPFLRLVHAVSAVRLARRVSTKLDALATMIEYERQTYEQWLNNPDLILKTTADYFSPVRQSFAWGKWNYVGVRL